jgi:integrase
MNIFLASVRDDRLYALWRLACRTGMRRGELAGLRWADVDLDAGELSVRQNLVIVGTTATIQEPKTERSKRTIALDDATVEALKLHRRRQLEERMSWGEAWTDSRLVFVREGGEAIYPDLVSHWFASAAEAAGLAVIRFHDIRHSYATASLESGMPVMILSARLGHSTPALTLNVYSHALPATDRAEAARVAAELD